MRNDEKEVSILESVREHLSRDLEDEGGRFPLRGRPVPAAQRGPKTQGAPGWPGGGREGRVGRTRHAVWPGGEALGVPKAVGKGLRLVPGRGRPLGAPRPAGSDPAVARCRGVTRPEAAAGGRARGS